MNANGDDHVSFSAMDVRCSPDGKLVAVSTDKDRIIILETGSEQQVRVEKLSVKRIPTQRCLAFSIETCTVPKMMALARRGLRGIPQANTCSQ